MNGETKITNRDENRIGGISRRRAVNGNFGCERCGLLIAANSIYFLLSPSITGSSAAERFHEACYERQTAALNGGQINEC